MISFFGSSILQYHEEDGDRDMLPILKRIVENKIPLLIFRFLVISSPSYSIKQSVKLILRLLVLT